MQSIEMKETNHRNIYTEIFRLNNEVEDQYNRVRPNNDIQDIH